MVAEYVDNRLIGKLLERPIQPFPANMNISGQDDNVRVSCGRVKGRKFDVNVTENVKLHKAYAQ